jgi:hypothetical protein
VLCSHKNKNSEQPINLGLFGSVDVTRATKRIADAGFGPLDATQAYQRLHPGSPKRAAGYQSRPYKTNIKVLQFDVCVPCPNG